MPYNLAKDLAAEMNEQECQDTIREGLSRLSWSSTYPEKAAAGLITAAGVLHRMSQSPESIEDISAVASLMPTWQLIEDLTESIEGGYTEAAAGICLALADRYTDRFKMNLSTIGSN